MDEYEEYKNEYEKEYKLPNGKVFNVLFHLGVGINIVLVMWIYLVFFGVI